MKGTALILLCALALTQASQSQRNSDDTKNCNCNPSEAQNICSDFASDGILISHENCNKFYQCFDGRPIPFNCPSNLLYDPVLEVCDWPQNVECGDRPILEEGSTGDGEDCDENIDDGQTEDNDSDNNSDGGNSQVEGEDCDENEDNSDATCNCNPSEAPNICKNENSDGILVAHENCNQFYKCFDGAPVTVDCPLNLMFNPKLEICDWPEKVECGDRDIPGGTEDSNNGGSDNEGSDNGSSDNGGSDNGSSDNGGNDKDDNENAGAGNCDPSEAPAICTSEGSNGVLVAHENCNQFYICSYGKPVAIRCPVNLLFNPNTDQCDWPENVECGDRVIPDGTEDSDNGGNDNGGNDYGSSDNGGSDNGGSDNGGSDNGSSDNGSSDNGGSDNGGNDNDDNENAGAGNCDPSEAPAICTSEGSNGVLVAHENCNQFYICSYGKPVAIRCPVNLLFNPITDQCDWPENVECGDRVIPDGTEDSDNGGNDNGGNDNGGNDYGSSDNGGSDNGSSDNGSSDNGSSDNGGSDNGGNDNNDNENAGAGNCDPSEAPAICTSEGSNGVLVAHENCNQFYICSYGKPVAMKCPGNLLFNPSTDKCDWPENVECGDRIIPDGTDSDDGGNDNGGSDNGGSDNGGSDNGGNDNGGSDNGGIDNGGSDNGSNGNVGAGNCDPSEAPTICGAEGSDGVLVAHENCNQFYTCSHGRPVVMKCPGALLFNPKNDQCDWPGNVNCGDRVIPDKNDNEGSDNGGSDTGGSDNGGNDNGGSDNGGIDNGGNGNVGAGNCDPSEAPTICAYEGSNGVLVAHENCNQFYMCSNGKPVALKCPGTLLFNPTTDYCDWPGNVNCGDRVIPDENDNGGSDNGGSDNGGSDNGGSDNGGSDNGGSDNGGSDNGVNDNGGSDNGGSDNGGSDNGGIDNGGSDNGGNGNVGAGNCDPSEAPTICASEGSNGVLVAHENCNQFYMCSNGKPVALKCPGTLLFNPKTNQCDWPGNVDCGDRVIPNENDNGGSDNGSNDNGGSDNGGSDNGGSDNGVSDNGGSDNGGNDNGGNDNVGAGNCDPSEAPIICASEGSNGVLVAHENCNQFYKCSYGKPVALNCPGTLLFNPKTNQCDWPGNVDCGDRVIPNENDNGGSDNGSNDNGGSDNGGSDNGGSDNGGSDNGGSDNGVSDNGGSDNGGNDNGGNDNVGAGNCDPSEAPIICASEGSNGVLVAHENCNQFYKCSYGKPVALNCPGTLLFNPKTNQCDWPGNVDCGDRVIPNENDNGGSDNGSNDNEGSDNGGSDNGGSDNGGSDNGGSDNGVSDNGGSDNGGNDNGGNDNVGAGNCDPSEAPIICASEGSNGVLVAHENCNQFYKCSYGKPVALNCPGTLLFNPKTNQCDWPGNVDCGDRVIPNENDNGGSDNGSNDNEGSDNGGSDNGGSDNGGSDNGSSDNGGSDNGGSDNEGNNNGGAGNCDPSEAPSICAENGSNGVLVAHENCNQYYVCVNGKPTALACPENLLFNPHSNICDWPSNVICGDRVIPDNTGNDDGSIENGGNDNGGNDNGGNDNGGNDNGGSDNEGSDNGGSDNGGNDNGDSGSGNSDPSEAAAICGSPGSNGVLVAHEKCNKFYMCSDGSPVPLLCSSNLLFNPIISACDWPRNVDCGDRIIPESEDVCLCNARQAPSICSGEHSNGLLIAHEYCNQYYVCVDGSPVSRSCPLNHLYNPHEAACDWAQNVSCDEREVSYSLNKHVDARQTIRF